MKTLKINWIVEHHEDGTVTWLPPELDRTKLVDVTKVGQQFRVYYHPQTFETHDSAKYRQQAIEMNAAN